MTSTDIETERATLSQLMLDRAPMMIAFVGPDECYQSVNPHYTRFFSMPIDEIIGRHVSEVVGPGAYEQLKEYIQLALQGQEVEYSEWLQLASGQMRYWSSSYQPLIVGGEVQGFFVYVVDSTAEKLAAQAQQDKERIYRDLFEDSAVSMAQLDVAWRWLDVNTQMCSDLGYERDELLALKMESIFHPADLAVHWPNIRQLLDGTDRYKADMRLISKDGSLSWGRVTLSAIRGDAGELLHLTLVSKDITAHKETAAALEQLNATLESRIEERTRELSSLNEELDAFNYSVSHDLRAPLRGIDGFSYVLLEEYRDVLDAQGQHYLERIQAGAKRLGELLDALLALSRVTRLDLQSTTVDISGIAAAKIVQLREEEPERNVLVDIQSGIQVSGDERLMRIVLRSLLENAWKFTLEREQARITVRAEHVESDLVISVVDNGVGFDPEHAEKLFVPFQTLHSPGRFAGHGVGLATVQRIIQRHGGRVWAESAVDEGATFSFTLKSSPNS